jgi:hypothetical protein
MVERRPVSVVVHARRGGEESSSLFLADTF